MDLFKAQDAVLVLQLDNTLRLSSRICRPKDVGTLVDSYLYLFIWIMQTFKTRGHQQVVTQGRFLNILRVHHNFWVGLKRDSRPKYFTDNLLSFLVILEYLEQEIAANRAQGAK